MSARTHLRCICRVHARGWGAAVAMLLPGRVCMVGTGRGTRPWNTGVVLGAGALVARLCGAGGPVAGAG